jgi:hypothetical protein
VQFFLHSNTSLKLHVKEDKVQRVPVRWNHGNHLKLNTDGAFDGNHGTGAVLRDCQSELVGACADHVEDALHAEALVVRKGLVMARARGALGR